MGRRGELRVGRRGELPRKNSRKKLGRCPVGLLGHGRAITGLKGPADSQGSAQSLGPPACYIEEFEVVVGAGFINQCGCPSLGEVGLKVAHYGCQRTVFSIGWWLQPVLMCYPLVPVGATNRY